MNALLNLLVVEDDPRIRELLERGLSEAGMSVRGAGTGGEARELLARRTWDAVVLDLMLPDMDGLELLRELRRRGDRVPVLVLTARDAVEERVAGLEAGADDYVVKPFALAEVVARLRALRRRAEEGEGLRLQVGDLSLDLEKREVRRRGRRVDLSPREFDLLLYFVRHRGVPLTRAMIAEAVWGMRTEFFSNVIDVYVGYLRRKLEQGGEPRLIHTVRGVGYSFSEEAP